MRRGVADALDAGNLRDVFDQHREVGNLTAAFGCVAAGVARSFAAGVARRGAAGAALRAATHFPPVGIDVLPQQRHFLDALRREAGDLSQHIFKTA